MSKLRLIGLIVGSFIAMLAIAGRTDATEGTLMPTTMSLAASPASVWLQTNTTFSGTLTATDTSTDPATESPVANETVELQVSTNSTSWTTLTTTTTNANGVFTSSVAITRASATYRAIFVGDATYAMSQSPSVNVTGFVASAKISNTSPAKVKAESPVTYSAHVAVYDSRLSGHPAIPGAKVDVYRQDVYGGGWAKVATLTTNANGTVSWRRTVSTPTRWKLSAHSTNRSKAAASIIFQPKVVPAGKVYALPSSAPKPKPLAPQSAAVGAGAHPVVSRIPNAIWNHMVGRSWHSGCPVGRSQLLYMTINYWGFDGYRHRGQLVFRAGHKSQFVDAFTRLYNNHIPLHGMYLVDRFGYSSRTHGADDYASMEHDNTSAFNCRWVDGNPGVLSPHSYGTAVDINPYENPYHSAKGWTPNSWWRNHYITPYTWRSRGDAAVRVMLNSGFSWTYGNEDSQHFDAR